MKQLRRFIHVFFVTIWLLSLLAPISIVSAQAPDEPPRAYPGLLQLAKEQPNEKVRVIVQRVHGQDLPEQAIQRAGGHKAKELPLINSLVLELPVKAVEALARNPAVRWISLDAPLFPSATAASSVRDEFTNVSYSGNNGTVPWSGAWQEIGESDGAAQGYVCVVTSQYCLSGNCLRLSNNGATRQVNLKGAKTAMLSFSYHRYVFSSTSASVSLQVSFNGGATWNTLKTYPMFNDGGWFAENVDLTPYLAPNTLIRLQASGYFDGYFYLDNVQVDYNYPVSDFIKEIGADRLRNEVDLDGQGVTVAVIDSGISEHEDFKSPDGSRLVASAMFGAHTDASDGNGHGTHVAGILAGSGSASNGDYRGVAPGVNLVNVKVSNQDGVSYTSDLVESIQWVYDNRAALNIRVVNISINSSVPESYKTSPLDAAVEILWLNGMVVVVSAGNNGSGNGPVPVYPPANDPFVITVGATDDKGTPDLADDSLATFSAYGTTEDGFAKPDLVAPGYNVISLLASPNAKLYLKHPKNRINPNYYRMSGTSMAAPVVSGAAALLLQSNPALNPDQVKYRLMASANKSWGSYNPVQAGGGSVDAYAAVFTATSEGANLGLVPSQLLISGSDPIAWDSVAWNSVAWNSVAWNSVAWNSVAWNSVAWNSVAWNSGEIWDD
jgi:serine protease AprX